MLGLSALAGIGKTATYAEAVERCLVCEASAEKFLQLMARHPSLGLRMIQTIAKQVLRLEEQVDQLAFEEVSVRLAQVLLQLAEDGGGQLPTRLTHSELAKLAGTTRATVTKTLSEFAGRGWVELGYRRLTILDPQGLRGAVRRV